MPWQPGGPAPCWDALPAGQEGDCPAVLYTGAASPQVLGAVLGARLEGYKAIRDHPEEGHKDDEGP